ncbi:hypothetical protein BDZ97DRAFT_1779207 [Flammula alnicola]|nr:hypothetical protein BDZ97DRAFT_1876515 [Flammula alnicola]KAF8956692.1 hypothetical protein BDZ97DRAFT_1850048 [Flammula alnicola]KAF8957609.1 hypothetical protein BDZ97DRAFT_1845744 [Flammula alnicola]KAF8960374.1 hypothetical protein BDZ97DRAFT_1834442 [Flammula alnicola]KAF8973072.1 hypothetical protein BDZ97DRAFT_1779207 [Flammula alnicola]
MEVKGPEKSPPSNPTSPRHPAQRPCNFTAGAAVSAIRPPRRCEYYLLPGSVAPRSTTDSPSPLDLGQWWWWVEDPNLR